jgi:hypothetical protein
MPGKYRIVAGDFCPIAVPEFDYESGKYYEKRLLVTVLNARSAGDAMAAYENWKRECERMAGDNALPTL